MATERDARAASIDLRGGARNAVEGEDTVETAIALNLSVDGGAATYTVATHNAKAPVTHTATDAAARRFLRRMIYDSRPTPVPPPVRPVPKPRSMPKQVGTVPRPDDLVPCPACNGELGKCPVCDNEGWVPYGRLDPAGNNE